MSFRIGAGAALLLLTVLGLVAYGNTLRGEWVWDDASSVLLHKHVQDPSKIFQLFTEDQHAFGRGQGNFYRPLVSVSFMIDYWLSYTPALDQAPDLPFPGVKPFLFHLTSLAWHVAAAFFLWLLLGRFGAAVWVRIAVAALWLVHPLHTEAVAYISGRADMMSGAFVFAGLYLATSPASGRAGLLARIGAILCFVLGLLSKEATFIFPVLLLLVLATRAAEPEGAPAPFLARRGSFALLGSVAALLLYAFLRLTVLSFSKGGGGSAAAPLTQRLVETLQALGWYAQLLFWPTHLHMERTLDGATSLTTLVGAAVLVALLGGAFVAWRAGQRRVALGLAWFLASWLPISGVFPLNAPMAEHWLYVPMAGLWWALLEAVALVTKQPAPRWIASAAVAALALLFVNATHARNEDWSNNERLFRSTLRENPKTQRVAYNLAVTYEDLDKNAAGARRTYEHLLHLYEADPLPGGGMRPDEPEVRLSYGKQLLKQGDYSEAIAVLAKLVPLSKDSTQAPLVGQALLAIGQCSLALGDFVQADTAFRNAAKLFPPLGRDAEAIADGGPLFPR